MWVGNQAFSLKDSNHSHDILFSPACISHQYQAIYVNERDTQRDTANNTYTGLKYAENDLK